MYKQDRYLLEINVRDMETLSGDNHYYLHLAMRVVRVNIMLKEMQVDGTVCKRVRRRRV